MENENEQLNNGIKNIRNIKMTDSEKGQIFQRIISSAKIQEIKKEKKRNVFQMFPNYSLYMRTTMYFILLASVGGLFWFNYKNINQQSNYNINNYNNQNIGAPSIPNENPQQIKYPTSNTINQTQTQNNKNPNPNNNYQNTTSNGMVAALAPTIVYKTRNDYSNNISVCYKNGEITCTPGPTDAIHQRPVKLSNGYLLKKMSGGVFLNITIDELINYKGDWVELIKVKNIIDYHPFTEIYSCPSGLSVDEINKIIESGELKTKCENIIDEYKM